MANARESFMNMLNQTRSIWSGMSTVNKAVAVGVVALIVFGLVSLVSMNKKGPYQYLFTDLSPEDTAAISSYLRKNGIDDFIADKKGIKVMPEKIVKLRMELSQQGLPAQGVIGWEKFDEQDFSRTEFEQKIHKMRAIQGELARTISAIDGVILARVHLVQPKVSVFVRENKKPTAAIYLKTKRGFELEKSQIRGIQHLVSRSVEGLETNNISIIDTNGRILTEEESTDAASKITKEMMSYKRKVESNLEERVRGIVGRIVGPDRIEVKVDAEVDFTQEKQLISDVDPDDVAVLSKNSSGFSMEGQGLNPTGIPGSKSNVPGEAEATTAGGSKSGSKRETELINYEVSKVTSEKTLPVGDIQRLSVSVLVDGKQPYRLDGGPVEFEPRTDEEMRKIEELVKSAVGFKDKRDKITVQNMLFQLDPIQVMELSKKKEEDRNYLSTLAVSAATALAIVLFFAFIVRPYFRWLSYDPQKKVEQSNVTEFRPDLEVSGVKNIKIQEDVPFEKLSPQEQVQYLARHEPKRTTEAIRLMLNPHS